jgi:hypothetical protein
MDLRTIFWSFQGSLLILVVFQGVSRDSSLIFVFVLNKLK